RVLKVAEQFQRRVLESAVAAIGILDAEGRFLTVSRCGVEITGYSNRELKGKDGKFLVVPDDQARIKRMINAVLHKGQRFSKMETRIICKDSTTKIIHFDLAPLEIENEVVGAIAAWEDVTAAKLAEEALKESESELRLLSSRLL